MKIADFVIEHADVVATCAGPAPRRGRSQRDISPLRDAAVAAHEGQIVFVGPQATLADHVTPLDGIVRIDARGCTIVPGFVDAHTHVVYAGDRRDELRQRLAGATYAEIAAAGGGILQTVRATRTASEEDLVALARVRLDEMAACGTTTCEAKSGYGLTVESELRQLRAIQRLDAEHAIDLVPTFLGAHEVPLEFRERPDDYVTLVVDDMIPRVADASLAKWCDVFCEKGAFTPEQSTRILQAGLRSGLRPRIHADELGTSGGARVAADVGARSADHLVFVDEHDAERLAAADVCAVLLPITALCLRLGRYAPARMLIARGVAVALGTDLNPGGGVSPSIPFALSLACFAMGMTLEEALIGATLNAAWSVDRSDTVGSLEPGKLMDAVVVRGDPTNLVRVGAPSIMTVIKRGKVIFRAQ
ncbi:MAG TPA: imidazolonepropionase [Vicinamibacterales bacterium]|nr:imidazolonepropionase [Vicinamibacterales bacterium]